MQEILEAYQTLSDPEKKKKVMMHSFSGIQNQWNGYLRHSSLSRREKTAESVSFVTYWNAYSSLNEILEKFTTDEPRGKVKSMPEAIARKA